MGKETSSICIEYSFAAGWHVFKSDDMPGLYVANQDAKKSFDDVKLAIEKLILLDENVKCTVQPVLTFEEFISRLKGKSSAKDESQSPVMSSKRYLVYASA